jgi:hypothetical protein
MYFEYFVYGHGPGNPPRETRDGCRTLEEAVRFAEQLGNEPTITDVIMYTRDRACNVLVKVMKGVEWPFQADLNRQFQNTWQIVSSLEEADRAEAVRA